MPTPGIISIPFFCSSFSIYGFQILLWLIASSINFVSWRAAIAACCAIVLILNGSLILFKSSITSFDAHAHPILSAARP